MQPHNHKPGVMGEKAPAEIGQLYFEPLIGGRAMSSPVRWGRFITTMGCLAAASGEFP